MTKKNNDNNKKPDVEADKLPAEKGDDTVKTVEKHAEERKTPAWEFAAATVLKGWAEGQEVTLREFRVAIADARKEKVG